MLYTVIKKKGESSSMPFYSQFHKSISEKSTFLVQLNVCN